MRRSHVLCSLGGLAALLAVAAVCYGYPQPAPKPPVLDDHPAPCIPGPTPEEKPRAVPSARTSAHPPVAHPDLTPWAPPTKPTFVPSYATVADCPAPAYRLPTAAVTSAAPAKAGTVYDLVERVESLKAKREAIDQELRETQALLREKFNALQERVGKADPRLPPAAEPAPQYYQPVTTYQTLLIKDPETGEVKRVVKPVTKYVLREAPLPAPAAVPPSAPQPVPSY
jgi:hypothetical protein